MAKLPTEKIFRYESKDEIHVTATDMGELVRCIDCKLYDSHNHRCKFFNHGIKENDFCSYGELKYGKNA